MPHQPHGQHENEPSSLALLDAEQLHQLRQAAHSIVDVVTGANRGHSIRQQQPFMGFHAHQLLSGLVYVEERSRYAHNTIAIDGTPQSNPFKPSGYQSLEISQHTVYPNIGVQVFQQFDLGADPLTDQHVHGWARSMPLARPDLVPDASQVTSAVRFGTDTSPLVFGLELSTNIAEILAHTRSRYEQYLG